MANSQLSISNLALRHFSQNPVINLTDNNPSVNAINAYWEAARDDVLSEHPWSFATVTKALSYSFNGAEYCDDWTFGYDYITQSIASLWYVYDFYTADKKDEQDFEVRYDPTLDMRVILTNLSNAVAEYSYVQDDVTLWSHKFVMAFSYRLAAMMCPIITGDAEKALTLMQLSNVYIGEEKRIDSTRKKKRPEVTSKYVNARGG